MRGTLIALLTMALSASGSAVQSPATVFKGRPSVKVSEGGLERTLEQITLERAINLECVISQIGGGDCWTWTALDADTKLIVSFRLGDRTLATAYDFMHDLADRIATKPIQLTTDGHRVYLFTTKHVLYYDVSEDVFAVNVPSSGTLFKRRSAAIAIQHLLRNHVEIVRCRVNRRGRLLKSSIPRLRSSLFDRLGHRRNVKRRHA